MPVRKVVTRSGKRFRGKFPSRKLGRMVQWESLLERDAILVLEHRPDVDWYEEQPSEEIYYDAYGTPWRYTPDFGVRLTDGSEFHIEVKPSGKLVDVDLCHKLALIERRYRETGRHFEIWTEREIRAEPRFSTLRTIHRARVRLANFDAQQQLAQLGDQAWVSFREAALALGGKYQVHRLLSQGAIQADFERALNDEAFVWLKDFKGARK